MLDNLQRDFRFAFRQLRQAPAFTATAILVLALGMSASLTIFTFVDAALLKPLPYRDPNRLVGVFETNALVAQSNLSYPDYLDWKRMNTVFESLDIYQSQGYTLTTPEGAHRVRAARISDGFFRTLGVTPVLGRDFAAGEDLASAPRVAMLSFGTWQARYGGRRDILGQTVTLSDQPTIIIGVLPRDFHFAATGLAEYWLAFHPNATGCDARRSCHGIYGVARLKDGVTVQAALSNVAALAKRLEQQYPESNREQGGTLAPLNDVLVGVVRPILLVLFSGAGLLLLIAAVNVAGLLLVRSESRQREIAVRTALGASAGRLASQFVTEAVVLTGAGVTLALGLAQGAIPLLKNLVSPDMMARTPFLRDLSWNGRIAVVACAIGIGAAVLLSIPPSLRIWSSDLRESLAEASRGSAGTTWRRLGGKLVVVELATAMILLTAAGLFGKSLYNLLRVPLGINPDHLVTIDIAAPDAAYGQDSQAIALARLVTAKTEGLPGVTSAGIAENGAPLSGNGNTTWFRVLGRPWHGEHNDVAQRHVSAGYFSTLGTRLLRGRLFREAEDQSKPKVAIINEAFAKRFFPGEDALGKQLGSAGIKPAPIEIVGIVDDIREGPLDVTIPPVLYTPFNQVPDDEFTLVARTVQAEPALLPAITAMVRQIDPRIAAMRGTTMSARVNDSQSAYLHRSLAWLVGGFAGIALLLGVVGLYGVIAYSVSQRVREIGIRMALGAQRGSVYRLILTEAGRLTMLGIAVGVAGSVCGAGVIRSLLFGVESWDVTTLAGVAGILWMAALSASFLPARRAASVNPVEALRAE
jgi:macrolide transport system ATP-binding/permease protein